MSLFSVSLTMFLIMNSVGHIIGYLDLVELIPSRRRKIIVVREMVLALLILLVFYGVGDWIFQALEINSQTVFISGGLILFLIAIRMIFPNVKPKLPKTEAQEPFIFPLATPMIAGPSALATTMLYAHQEQEGFVVLVAIFLAWCLSITVLFFADQIYNFLGKKALSAIERLMGLILTMMAVEMLLNGIKSIVINGIITH